LHLFYRFVLLGAFGRPAGLRLLSSIVRCPAAPRGARARRWYQL